MTTLVLGIDARSARRGAQEFGHATHKVERDARGATQRVKTMEGAFSRLRGAVFSLKGVLAGVGFGLLAREVINATTRMQRIESTFQAATGSAKEAGKSFQFVREESERLGLSLPEAAEQFAQLQAAAKGTALEGDETRRIFSAIGEAATAMGLRADQTTGALNAIQQMISKGNVQAEELRGQLGERLPGAFQITARAMGVTTVELNKMLDNGQLLAEDVLPKLATALEKTFSDQATKASDNLQQNINRMQTAVFDMMAQEGGMPALNNAIKDFTQTIKDDDFQKGFDKFIGGVAKLAELGGRAAAGIGNLFPDQFDFSQTDQKIAALNQERARLLEEQFRNRSRGMGGLVDQRIKEVERKLHNLGVTPSLSANTFEAGGGNLGIRQAGGFINVNKNVSETLTLLEKIDAKRKEMIASGEIQGTAHNTNPGNPFVAYGEAAEAANKEFEYSGSLLERIDKNAKTMAQDSASAMSKLSFTFSSAFEDAIVAGKDLRGVLRGLAQDIQRIILRQTITQPAGNWLASAITGAITGGATGSGMAFGTGSSPAMATSANGNIFTGPSVTSIAERGNPEAVLPLTRRNGKLGVQSSGGGNQYHISIHSSNADDVRRAIPDLVSAIKRVDRSVEGRAVAAVSEARARS